MSIINDPNLVNLSLHRNTRNTRKGIMAHACMETVRPSAVALDKIRQSRESLDGIFHSGKLFDIAARLRDVCYGIDSANAEEDAENA